MSFIVSMVGGVRAADLLHVAPSQVSRWTSGQEMPRPETTHRILELDHVLASLIQVWEPEVAGNWLTTANGWLGGARPIDVLRTRGSGEVLEAIQAEAAGAYA